MRALASQATLFPLEFFIAETPKSLQASARTKALWRSTVRDSACARVEATVGWTILDERRVSVTIFYFAPAEMEGDVDNIVKLIVDGMINVAYLNDNAVERIVVQKFEPGIERSFNDVSEQLAAALDTEAPVVYICVHDDLRWRAV